MKGPKAIPVDRPCPFCGGGSTSRLRLPSRDVFWVQCDRCQAEGPKAATLAAAVNAWNAAAVARQLTGDRGEP